MFYNNCKIYRYQTNSAGIRRNGSIEDEGKKILFTLAASSSFRSSFDYEHHRLTWPNRVSIGPAALAQSKNNSCSDGLCQQKVFINFLDSTYCIVLKGQTLIPWRPVTLPYNSCAIQSTWPLNPILFCKIAKLSVRSPGSCFCKIIETLLGTSKNLSMLNRSTFSCHLNRFCHNSHLHLLPPPWTPVRWMARILGVLLDIVSYLPFEAFPIITVLGSSVLIQGIVEVEQVSKERVQTKDNVLQPECIMSSKNKCILLYPATFLRVN